MKESLWLVGSGPMAVEYAKVLHAQKTKFKVIGRGAVSAYNFNQSTGLQVVCGGLDAALADLPVPEQAIVAVGIEHIALLAQHLINAGCRRILLEKPGALHLAALTDLHAAAQAHGAQIYIGYNRRFYASVKKLRELVSSDGGIVSAYFEFTEWSNKIRPLQKGPGVKERWLLANSSHVLDLAFSLVGYPAEGQWQGWHSGSLDWHPIAARFHGAGVSERGIPFVYQADWEAPGRWGIEVLTRYNRYLLRPMEQLHSIPLGSIEEMPIALDDQYDHQYKPGLFYQCESFLSSNPKNLQELCSLEEQINAFSTYCQIAGYQL